MKSLMLLSNEDRENLPKIILTKGVIIRSDKAITQNLLNEDYTNVIITSNYAKTYGDNIVIKVFQLINAFTSAKIIYLIPSGLTNYSDNVTKWMLSIGINNIYNVNWKTLSLVEFESIIAQNKLISPIKIRTIQQSEAQLQIMKSSLEILTKIEAPSYFETNKGKLIDLIQNQIQLVKDNNELVKEKVELQDINDYLKKSVANLDVKLNNKDIEVNKLKKDLSDLRYDALKNQSAIYEYNNKLENNDLASNPKIQLDKLAPTVLYFKEYEDIGFDNFFESIVYLLTNVYKIYTKTLIIEKQYRNYYNPYVDAGYISLGKEVKEATLINSDKFVIYGNPTNTVRSLAKPENRVEVLIVLDKTGTEDILIDHDRLVPFYIGSYRNKIMTLDIPEESWVSTVEGKWMSITPLMDRRILKDNELIVYRAVSTTHPLSRYIKTFLIGDTK